MALARVDLTGREAAICDACGHRMTICLTESHPDWARWVFKCITTNCEKRERRRWYGRAAGGGLQAIDSSEIRRLAAERVAQHRRRGRVRLPRCRTCRRERIVTRYDSKSLGLVLRAYCRACRRSETFSLDGKKPVDLRRGRLRQHESFPRPTCPCGRPMVRSGRWPHTVLGVLLKYRCNVVGHAPEVRTEAGRLVSDEELQRAHSKATRKTELSIRPACARCGRPMSYQGRRRSGLHAFACQRDHERFTVLVDAAGNRADAAPGSKRFPWGPRPVCQCGGPLVSQGEREDAGGRRLFVLVCRNDVCGERELLFDETGTLVRRPRGLVRRRRADRPVTGGAKVWCRACVERPVPDSKDRRFRYCVECGKNPVTAWRQAQRAFHGPERFALDGRIRSPEAIRRQRSRLSLTQQQLATEAGISLVYVKKLEGGRLPISKRVRRKLVDAFLPRAYPARTPSRNLAT